MIWVLLILIVLAGCDDIPAEAAVGDSVGQVEECDSPAPCDGSGPCGCGFQPVMPCRPCRDIDRGGDSTSVVSPEDHRWMNPNDPYTFAHESCVGRPKLEENDWLMATEADNGWVYLNKPSNPEAGVQKVWSDGTGRCEAYGPFKDMSAEEKASQGITDIICYCDEESYRNQDSENLYNCVPCEQASVTEVQKIVRG